jgi:group I intron endonuclease
MLVWQTYWQPIAKKQFPLILQDKTKCGIYKITNLITDECYIGQSNDIYRRWSDHCKCGLGIDTPVGNKLYKAIQEYGLENFTFELLVECSQDELNEKEKYFIELYQADTFGYNSTKGNIK